MSLYTDYLTEIETRKGEGLHPKPIDDGALVAELIAQIEDTGNAHRKDSLNFFIYNTLPGTTSAAGVKAAFLKKIILGESVVAEITPDFAFELLSHMKGGPSVEVLLDLALGDDADIAAKAGDVLKTQVFLYEADMDRLAKAHAEGSACSHLLPTKTARLLLRPQTGGVGVILFRLCRGVGLPRSRSGPSDVGARRPWISCGELFTTSPNKIRWLLAWGTGVKLV